MLLVEEPISPIINFIRDLSLCCAYLHVVALFLGGHIDINVVEMKLGEG